MLVSAAPGAAASEMYSLGPKPALIRQPTGTAGGSIELEVWEMPIEKVGCARCMMLLKSIGLMYCAAVHSAACSWAWQLCMFATRNAPADGPGILCRASENPASSSCQVYHHTRPCTALSTACLMSVMLQLLPPLLALSTVSQLMLVASSAPCCRYFLRDGVKEPLGIGDVLLEDNTTVKGFIGETYAVAAAPEITSYGGWRAYLADSNKQ